MNHYEDISIRKVSNGYIVESVEGMLQSDGESEEFIFRTIGELSIWLCKHFEPKEKDITEKASVRTSGPLGAMKEDESSEQQ